jgi:hypothetical protein
MREAKRYLPSRDNDAVNLRSILTANDRCTQTSESDEVESETAGTAISARRSAANSRHCSFLLMVAAWLGTIKQHLRKVRPSFVDAEGALLGK